MIDEQQQDYRYSAENLSAMVTNNDGSAGSAYSPLRKGKHGAGTNGYNNGHLLKGVLNGAANCHHKHHILVKRQAEKVCMHP